MTRLVLFLADDAPRNTGPDFGKASPFGLLIIVLLLIGTFVLVWSMNRQLKKVPASFDEEPEPDEAVDEAVDAGTVEPPPDAPAGDEGQRHEPG